MQSTFRAPLLWVLLPWMTGYWLANRFHQVEPLVLVCLAICALSLSIFLTRLRNWGFAFAIGTLCAGGSYYSSVEGIRKVKEPCLSMPISVLELLFEGVFVVKASRILAKFGRMFSRPSKVPGSFSQLAESIP